MTTPDDVVKAAQFLRSQHSDYIWSLHLAGKVKDGGVSRCTAILVDHVLSQHDVERNLLTSDQGSAKVQP